MTIEQKAAANVNHFASNPLVQNFLGKTPKRSRTPMFLMVEHNCPICGSKLKDSGEAVYSKLHGSCVRCEDIRHDHHVDMCANYIGEQYND